MRLSLRARALVGGTVALGLGALAFAGLKAASMPLSTLVLLGAAVALTELFQVSADADEPDPAQASNFSFSSGVHIASVIMLGPWAGAIVGAFGVLAVDPFRGVPWRRTVFNANVFALSTLAGGYAFLAAGGQPGSADFPAVLGPVGALALTYTALNTVLVGCAVSLTSSTALWPFLRGSLRTELSSKAAEAGWGAAFARFGIYDPWAIVVLVPLVVAIYQAHARLSLLRRETARALETFANVIDERDPYTYRHSARVADYVAQLAEQLRLADSEVERLRWAGRLHDLGKISVDASVLQRPGRPTPGEWAALQRHPRLSARLLRRFNFAAREAQAVEYHHERYDGTGYYGIDAVDQPLASHFLVVADSFDAMTTDRPYRRALSREEALAEIEGNLGRQFHPAVGAAFVAMQRGLDPLGVLTPEQRKELRTLSTASERPRLGLGKLADVRRELPTVGTIVVALGAVGFHAYALAGGALAVAGALVGWRSVQLARSRRLAGSLRRQLSVPAVRQRRFDTVVSELGRQADIRWAGLVHWEETGMTGVITLERGVTAGPTELALTSWLVRDADSGRPLLVASGAEVGRDGQHVAIPLTDASGTGAFLVLVFARSVPWHLELALRTVREQLSHALCRPEASAPPLVAAISAAAAS